MKALRRRPALVAAAAAVVCAAACSLLPGPAWARVPFGLALLFVLPGFAVWTALFPRRREDALRTITFTVGISVAVGVLGGVTMGAYGVLSTETWGALMAGVTIVAALCAQARPPAPDTPRPRRTGLPTARVGVGATLAIIAALLVVGTAIGLARTPLPVPYDRGYTVLSIGPTGDPDSVTVRISSSEANPRRFRLELRVPGRPKTYRPVQIAPGQTINEPVALPPIDDGAITASLIDDTSGTPRVYRRVRLTLPVQGPPPVVSGSGKS